MGKLRPARHGALMIVVLMLGAGPAFGQPAAPAPFRVDGFYPANGRNSVTESWGVLRFNATNLNAEDRTARVLTFYREQPELHFGRELWLPGRARMNSWVPIGPAPYQTNYLSREIKYLIYDRSEDETRLLAPGGDERLHSRILLYRKREPHTAIVVDGVPNDPYDGPDPLRNKDSAAWQSVLMARTFRFARGLSDMVTVFPEPFLPPTAEAFDGIDQIFLAGNRLAEDPVGRQALRHWVQRGGALWVLLEQVDPTVIAPILGDDLGFEIVDRTSLSSVRMRAPSDDASRTETRDYDQPVPFVRVLVNESATVHYEIDGWPAAFSRAAGRGKIMFLTLGRNGWHKPRNARYDPLKNLDMTWEIPAALPAYERLGVEMYPEPQKESFQPDDLEPLLTAEIGYAVISRTTVALVLGGFAISLIVLGRMTRQARRPGLARWLVPAAALVAAGILVGLGTARRQAIPATTGSVAVLDVAPGSGEAAADGLFAIYRPESGPLDLSSAHGGIVELDPTGLGSQTRRRVQTDLDAWHWEGLAFPAGVRLGPFRATVSTGAVTARARFGANGVEGTARLGRFERLADALLLAEAREVVTVRLQTDGTFVAEPHSLPSGQFLTGGLLDEGQQRRQEVYRRLLNRPLPQHLDGRNLLMAWADASVAPFVAAAGDKVIGSVLLVIPVEFDRTPAGTKVMIPSAFIPFTSIVQGRPIRPTMESNISTQLRLRFQLPAAVLPMTVERAVLHVNVRAPSRRLAVNGYLDNRPERLLEVENPVDPLRVEITDTRQLRPDADGYLYFGINVGERTNVDQSTLTEKWKIESLGLEVSGTTANRE